MTSLDKTDVYTRQFGEAMTIKKQYNPKIAEEKDSEPEEADFERQLSKEPSIVQVQEVQLANQVAPTKNVPEPMTAIAENESEKEVKPESKEPTV